MPTTPIASHNNRRSRTSSEIASSPSSYNRLVFLTSSDSSSKEEDFDNDCECDWDYFEPSPETQQIVQEEADNSVKDADIESDKNCDKSSCDTPKVVSDGEDTTIVVSSASSCCQSCGSRPKYVPVPIPVPVPVPVPWWGPRESLVLFRNALPRPVDPSSAWMWSAPTVTSTQYGPASFYPGFHPQANWLSGFESNMYPRMPLIAPSLMDFDRQFASFGMDFAFQEQAPQISEATSITFKEKKTIDESSNKEEERTDLSDDKPGPCLGNDVEVAEPDSLG